MTFALSSEEGGRVLAALWNDARHVKARCIGRRCELFDAKAPDTVLFWQDLPSVPAPGSTIEWTLGDATWRIGAEAVKEDNLLRRHADAMSALRTSMLCKGCGGTVGDHLAPDQGGCPGHFVIDGVEMIPSGHRDKLRAEVDPQTGDPSRLLLVGDGWTEGLPIMRMTREGETLRVEVQRPHPIDVVKEAVPTATGQVERLRRDVAQNHVNASAASVVAELGAACCCGLHLPGRVVRAVRDLAWRLATLKAVRK